MTTCAKTVKTLPAASAALRDKFAHTALQELMTHQKGLYGGEQFHRISKLAYELADAMLKARKAS